MNYESDNIEDDVVHKTSSMIKVEAKSAKTKVLNPKRCKVLFWNKYSRNIAFDFDGKSVQIVLDKPLSFCNGTVSVLKSKDNIYTIV